MNLVSIDPDTTLFGWAHFQAQRLHACKVARTPYLPIFPADTTYLCEVPEDRKKSPARKSDILTLALAAGRIVGTRDCKFVTPTHWKGQIPKGVHHKRVWEVLDPEETGILTKALENTKKGAHPEILDAVALGLSELWRL